jgi:hypothetical protein
MSIQYIADNVQFSAPNGTQTDYEALIQITVSVQNTDGSWADPVTFNQTLTGYVSQDMAVVGYNAARQAINDATLTAFALANPD